MLLFVPGNREDGWADRSSRQLLLSLKKTSSDVRIKQRATRSEYLVKSPVCGGGRSLWEIVLKKKKKKVQVYSLVSRLSAKRHSPDSTQLPPGHRSSSFISHLNSPGSMLVTTISGAQNYSNTQAFTVLLSTHLLLGRGSARVGKVPLPRSTTSEHNSAQPGMEPATSGL